MHRYNPVTVITFVFFFGWLFVIPVGFNQFISVDYSTLPTTIWWELGFIVFCTTFLAYLFNILALRHASSSLAGAYIYSQPVLAVLFAYIVKWLGYGGDAHYGWTHFFATILIFTGVYLVSFAGVAKEPKHEAELANTINE
jgi:drug/metabolite transporter (DMT)-like permease